MQSGSYQQSAVSHQNEGNNLNASVPTVSMPALSLHNQNVMAIADALNEDADLTADRRKAPPITGGEDMPVGEGLLVLMILTMVYTISKLTIRRLTMYD